MSEVTDWVKKAVAATEEEVNARGLLREPRRVTVRLTGLLYESLRLIADKTGHTPTGCAEELLEAAITEGLQALGYSDYSAVLPELIERVGGVAGLVDHLTDPPIVDLEVEKPYLEA